MNVGIFGGAFDPFHIGHRRIIECARGELNLDKVVVVPSFMPPHKNSFINPFSVRREMAEAGTAGLDYVIVDDLEARRGAVNPTSVTLPLLKEKYPCDGFFFIMGGDSAVNFHTWIDPARIASAAVLVVAERNGCEDAEECADRIAKSYDADVRVLRYTGDWVSSSRIKASYELGLGSEEVSAAVAAVIEKYALYRRYSLLVERLTADLPASTFGHCASTAVYAEGFAGVLKLKFEEVFEAALLHDCAKHLHIDIEGVPAPVSHQFTGADRAKSLYGVEDENVLDAIRYHTSGKPEMTTLGKLIFCADMLEPCRSFVGAEELRNKLERGFEEGFRACVEASYKHLTARKGEIYPLTKECAEYYNIINNAEER